jgi:hypothetical protein
MTPRKRRIHDRRTRPGKAYRDGYRAAFAGEPIDAAARGRPTWEAYEEGFASGSADRAKADWNAAELARLRKDEK